MRCDGVAHAVEVWGQEREDDKVWMAMDLYPRTINEDLIACGQTLMMSTTWVTLLLSCSVGVLLQSTWRQRQLVMVWTNDHESLMSSTTGKLPDLLSRRISLKSLKL